MNTDLAAIYGTPGGEAAQQENLEKAAEAELFAKLASEAGIDLNELSDEQIQELYTKVAEGATCDKCEKAKGDCTCDKGGDKEAQAYAEFSAQQEWGTKIAEADHLGRVMAHSMTQELGEIEKSAKKAPPGAFRKGIERAGELMSGSKLPKTRESAGKAWSAKQRISEEALEQGRKLPGAGKSKGPRDVEQLRDMANQAIRGHRAEQGKVWGTRAAAIGTPAAIAGRMSKENAANGSAIDELAAEQAVIKAAEAGWDVDQAAQRVGAVLTLGGPGESEKIAYASDLDEATEVRALEFLDAAGYEVNWD